MKKVCFISSTRADYGLLKLPMKRVLDSSILELQLIVTGSHLCNDFGLTYQEIENDGFKISKKVDLGTFEDSRLSIALQVAASLKGASEALSNLKPDAVVVLGDRYEMLGAAQAAFFLNIPLVHIHGGEVTEGAIDDSIRHAITKLSTYHITSTEEYKKRVIQLGESPDHVFCLGSTGLENFLKTNLMNQEEIEKSLNFKLKKQNLLITFHPVTAAHESVAELITALSEFDTIGQIITLPNSDHGYSEIKNQFIEYAKEKEHILITPSLGQLRYNSMMKIADLVVGNSSSGIVEAPFCGTLTLNIGERQKGRVMDLEKITNTTCEAKEIHKSLELLLESNKSKAPSMLYGDGTFSDKFIQFIENKDFKSNKKFYDIDFKLNKTRG